MGLVVELRPYQHDDQVHGPEKDKEHGRAALDVLATPDPAEKAAKSFAAYEAWRRGELTARGALAVGMSGSGPTLFGVFTSHAAARAAAATPLQAPAWLRVATARESG